MASDRRDFVYWATGVIFTLIALALTINVWPRLALFAISWFLALKVADLMICSRFGLRRYYSYAASTVVVFATTWFYYGAPQYREERASITDGYISQPSPHSNSVLLQIGKNGIIRGWAITDARGLGFFRDQSFSVEEGSNGIEITTIVRDKDGHVVIDIDHNHWRVYAPWCSDKNFTTNAIEALDSRRHVVLFVRLLPDRAQVLGEWHNDNGMGVMFQNPVRQLTQADFSGKLPGRGLQEVIGLQNGRNADEKISPLFDYPSSECLGLTRVDAPNCGEELR